jgi:hypothetical protein
LAIIIIGPSDLLLVASHLFALPAHVLSTAGDAEYVTLQKYVSHYVLFCHLTHKTKLGTANGWGVINSKPPGPITMMGKSETLKSYLLQKMCTAERCFGFYQLTRSQIILYYYTPFTSKL